MKLIDAENMLTEEFLFYAFTFNTNIFSANPLKKNSQRLLSPNTWIAKNYD